MKIVIHFWFNVDENSHKTCNIYNFKWKCDSMWCWGTLIQTGSFSAYFQYILMPQILPSVLPIFVKISECHGLQKQSDAINLLLELVSHHRCPEVKQSSKNMSILRRLISRTTTTKILNKLLHSSNAVNQSSPHKKLKTNDAGPVAKNIPLLILRRTEQPFDFDVRSIRQSWDGQTSNHISAPMLPLTLTC
jgi:hypothetical protein